MRTKYNFYRGFVFMEFEVEGVPLEIELPVYDVSVGHGYADFIYIVRTKSRDAVGKPGLADRYNAELSAVVVSNSPGVALEDGDRITVIGRLQTR